MTHYNIEIQIPTQYNPDKNNNRKDIEQFKFHRTYYEILETFGGVNTRDSPINGAWKNPQDNKKYFDKNISYNVLVETKGQKDAQDILAIKKLKKYKNKLKSRFKQEEICMVATRCLWL